MASTMETLQLFLINNDPLATAFMTSTGQLMYSAKTPRERNAGPSNDSLSLDSLSLDQSRHIAPSTSSAPTRIYRLAGAVSQSRGHVETEVGMIEPPGDDNKVATVNMYLEQCFQLKLGEGELKSLDSSTGVSIADAEQSLADSSSQMTLHKDSWGFMGPDEKKYIWQMFVKSPILVLADRSFVPLARYRRAKVGIVSRARKGFLEILPEGLPVVDMIIVTFVAFMKHRVPSNLQSFKLFPSEESELNVGQATRENLNEPPSLGSRAT
ncbi:hypothetical protein BKA70DRAFT_1314803 [Coprinopsis sp. MPI-PUGE-AT-0042]|nr:hypothetical protein BKA70DRAFT_1314803 [Coprinopsis sp. MPI-PUGE-AT-0042]